MTEPQSPPPALSLASKSDTNLSQASTLQGSPSLTCPLEETSPSSRELPKGQRPPSLGCFAFQSTGNLVALISGLSGAIIGIAGTVYTTRLAISSSKLAIWTAKRDYRALPDHRGRLICSIPLCHVISTYVPTS